MNVGWVLREVSGWLELGLADEALACLDELPAAERARREAMGLRLAAEMTAGRWEIALDLGHECCRRWPEEPEPCIHTAYCLHELGRTREACEVLQAGPRELEARPTYHYNLGCYLWRLGDSARARRHLAAAFALEPSLIEHARTDRDLAGFDIPGDA